MGRRMSFPRRGWLVLVGVGWGAVGCGSGVVVVWVVTDLFGDAVAVAVVGFGDVVRASFVVCCR